MQIIPLDGQTWVDVTLQSTGDTGRLVNAALLAGVSITDDVLPGEAVNVLTPAKDKVKIVKQLTYNRPASAYGFAASFTALSQLVGFIAPVNSRIRVMPMQTLADMAVQEAGGVAALIAIALSLGLSPTDDVEAGTIIAKPVVINNTVYEGLKPNKPASGIIDGTASDQLEGIGYWAIGLDFIVS